MVDLTKVGFIDSSGLATLIEALQAVGKYGGRLRLFGLSPAVQNLFKLSNLISIFDIRDTREDAVRVGADARPRWPSARRSKLLGGAALRLRPATWAGITPPRCGTRSGATRHVGPFRGRPVHARDLWSQMVRVGPRVAARRLRGELLHRDDPRPDRRQHPAAHRRGLRRLRRQPDVASASCSSWARSSPRIIMTGFIGAALAAEIGTMVVHRGGDGPAHHRPRPGPLSSWRPACSRP